MHSLQELENFAAINHIPIARKQTVEYMISLIKEKNYTSFFEIGTAIGYTSLIMINTFPDLRLVTIEHDLERAQLAIETFEHFNVSRKIRFLIDDAVEYTTDEMFDLIFIDASKKRKQYFLDKFSKNLNKGGTIIVDNMNLNDLWIKINVKKRAQYDKANQEFKDYIYSLEDYEVNVYDDIGDGIAVLTKK